MKIIKTVISNTMPPMKECLWLKPENGGFSAILMEEGNQMPLNIVNSKTETATTGITMQDVVGSVQDEKTKMTLWGLRNYIDSKVTAAEED